MVCLFCGVLLWIMRKIEFYHWWRRYCILHLLHHVYIVVDWFLDLINAIWSMRRLSLCCSVWINHSLTSPIHFPVTRDGSFEMVQKPLSCSRRNNQTRSLLRALWCVRNVNRWAQTVQIKKLVRLLSLCRWILCVKS